MALHALEGKAPPFSPDTLAKIEGLKAVYGLDLTAADAHHLTEGDTHEDRHAQTGEPHLYPIAPCAAGGRLSASLPGARDRVAGRLGSGLVASATSGSRRQTACSSRRRSRTTRSGTSPTTSRRRASSLCADDARRDRCASADPLAQAPQGARRDITYTHTSLGEGATPSSTASPRPPSSKSCSPGKRASTTT